MKSAKFPKLSTLVLNNNRTTTRECPDFYETLQYCPIEKLCLSNNICPRDIPSFCNNLYLCKNLKYLDISSIYTL